MTTKDVLRELQSLGTAQNRKVYARHGVKGPCFGVSYANLGKIRKQLRTDHELAQELWASGNHDARVLAAQIADPARMTARTLDAWAKDLDNYVITDAFAKLSAARRIGPVEVDHGETGCKTPDAEAYIRKMAGCRAR